MRGPQIVGVASATGGEADRVKTRLTTWRIEKKTGAAGKTERFDDSGVATAAQVRSLSSLGPVTITVRSESGVGSPSAWSNPNETSMYGPH
jgi:hypothetical protein